MAFENGPSYSAYQAKVWMRNLTTKKDSQIIGNNDYLNYFDFYVSEQQLVYAEQCNIYTSNINGSSAFTFLVCVPCDCFSDDPQIRYSDGLIAYHNQHYGVYTCNANGSNPQKMANTVPGDMYPTWSPNGKWIAYLKTSSNSNIYKINAATGDTTRLTSFTTGDTVAPNPNFSQNGKNVYFIGRIKNKLGIYKVKADGSGTYSLFYALKNQGSIYDYFLGKSDTKIKPLAIAQNSIVYKDDAVKSENSTLHIYPNPSNGSFTVVMDKVYKEADVIITDVTGKKIYGQTLNNASSASVQLHAAKGIYFINLKTGSATAKQKLVIQ